MNPDNACTLRITAAAGTELAGAYSSGTFRLRRIEVFIPREKKFTIHRTLILHAGWLDQTCVHCPIFPTAASRRSRARVSVPVWLIILSDQLPIVGLVSRYLTNYLIGRTLILYRLSFNIKKMPSLYIMGNYSSFPKGMPQYKVDCVRVTHPYATRQRYCYPVTVRLACIRPPASVHPEPRSNSPL